MFSKRFYDAKKVKSTAGHISDSQLAVRIAKACNIPVLVQSNVAEADTRTNDAEDAVDEVTVISEHIGTMNPGGLAAGETFPQVDLTNDNTAATDDQQILITPV